MCGKKGEKATVTSVHGDVRENSACTAQGQRALRRNIQRSRTKSLGYEKHNGRNEKPSWGVKDKAEELRKVNRKAKRWRTSEKRKGGSDQEADS